MTCPDRRHVTKGLAKQKLMSSQWLVNLICYPLLPDNIKSLTIVVSLTPGSESQSKLFDNQTHKSLSKGSHEMHNNMLVLVC